MSDGRLEVAGIVIPLPAAAEAAPIVEEAAPIAAEVARTTTTVINARIIEKGTVRERRRTILRAMMHATLRAMMHATLRAMMRATLRARTRTTRRLNRVVEVDPSIHLVTSLPTRAIAAHTDHSTRATGTPTHHPIVSARTTMPLTMSMLRPTRDAGSGGAGTQRQCETQMPIATRLRATLSAGAHLSSKLSSTVWSAVWIWRSRARRGGRLSQRGAGDLATVTP